MMPKKMAPAKIELVRQTDHHCSLLFIMLIIFLMCRNINSERILKGNLFASHHPLLIYGVVRAYTTTTSDKKQINIGPFHYYSAVIIYTDDHLVRV
jgi:hypothetical protein